ncbi:MAG TPA: hypothetical protein VFM46_04230, partial [Pseudomonadales bacterium]|nr:hypothetical protein [Pseudomonadales bacterium]
TQYIISNGTLQLQAKSDGTGSAFLKAQNVDIGLTSTFGTINLYGVTNARQYLRLRTWFGDGVYMEIFNRGATPNTRSAWFGFGDASTTQLTISNELGSTIYLSATDKVIVSNSVQIGNVIHFVRQSGTPAAIPGVVQMYQGGDGNMYFRGPNGYVRITGLTLLNGSFP